MAVSQVVDRFVYWIRERHKVYLRRRGGLPAPWTSDQVLQSVFFTCPYRENDKTTAWYREAVRDPMRDDPRVIFATVCFRWFNWIPTGLVLQGAGLLWDWNTRRAVALLSGLRDQRAQIFSGAFMITPANNPKRKIERVCEDYLAPVWDDMPRLVRDAASWQTLAAAYARLSQYLGLGGSGFMAGQVLADLKYTSVLSGATDWWSWCNLGPGGNRGLNRLMDRPLGMPLLPGWLEEVNRLRAVVARALPKHPPMHAQDVQHSLCEFDKYERVRLGQGEPKRVYRRGR